MGLGDTFRDSSHDLAHYIYDPFWNQGEIDPRLCTGLAVWAALRLVYPDPFIHVISAPLDAAMQGDMPRLDKLIALMGGAQPPDEQRRDYLALAKFIEAIDEHLTPLLPSVDWLLEPYREEAQGESAA